MLKLAFLSSGCESPEPEWRGRQRLPTGPTCLHQGRAEKINRMPEIVLPPAPAGTTDAVCVDIIDLGVVKTPWGEKHQEKFVFEIDALKQNGERFVVSRTFNVSDHELSAMRQALSGWRGIQLGDEDAWVGLDRTKLTGETCRLRLSHSESKAGRKYARVEEILPVGETHLDASGKYQRWTEN